MVNEVFKKIENPLIVENNILKQMNYVSDLPHTREGMFFEFPEKIIEIKENVYGKMNKFDMNIQLVEFIDFIYVVKQFRNYENMGDIIKLSSPTTKAWLCIFVTESKHYMSFCKEYLGFYLHHSLDAFIPTDYDYKEDYEFLRRSVIHINECNEYRKNAIKRINSELRSYELGSDTKECYVFSELDANDSEQELNG